MSRACSLSPGNSSAWRTQRAARAASRRSCRVHAALAASASCGKLFTASSAAFTCSAGAFDGRSSCSCFSTFAFSCS